MIDDAQDQELSPIGDDDPNFKTLKNNKLGSTISSTQQYFQTQFQPDTQASTLFHPALYSAQVHQPTCIPENVDQPDLLPLEPLDFENDFNL